MTRELFCQSLDHCVVGEVCAVGADAARYADLRSKMPSAFATMKQKYAAQIDAICSLPSRTDDLAQIESIATHIAEHFTSLVVVGMGGSSLGGETLAQLRKQGGLVLHFIDNIDPYTLALLSDTLPWKSTAFLVISKSGNTVEVHAQLAMLLRMAGQHQVNVAKQFFMMTILNDNPLHRLAVERGMTLVAHDPDLCGRFSILSPVGLIPAAAVGVDIRALRAGASIVLAENETASMGAAADAAAMHKVLMEHGIRINVMMHYCDRLGGFTAWYRQCWSESLGKNGMGTLPVRSRGATEQHSQLQLYLEGPRDKLFTALVLDSSGQGAAIDFGDASDARLNYLRGHTLGDLILAEQRASNDALVEAGCPLRSIYFDRLDENVMGALLMHATLEVMYTGALMGVNPFDQPAVESSKRATLAYLSGK